MAVPTLTIDDVKRIVPEASDIQTPMRGGQKLVFPCKIEGEERVLKFLLANLDVDTLDTEAATRNAFDEVTARAIREIETMRQCNSPYIVRIGPISLKRVEFNNQNLLFFSEEMIKGEDVKETLLRERQLPIREVILIGIHITEAIKILWNFSKIHRDIKPGNIIKNQRTMNYVLLDMGLTFDLSESSITRFGIIVGTIPYLSPERTQFNYKRQLDFRSDLFSLGIVLYEGITGKNPFLTPNIRTSDDVVHNILTLNVPSPNSIRQDIPIELNDIIIRLLTKHPHSRYRTCDELLTAFTSININEGG